MAEEVEVETALQYLLEATRTCDTGRCPLINCWDRILAEDIIADVDFPPFDRSSLDGYAVISQDVVNASSKQPVLLEQIDYIPAGSVGRHTITAGQTARIMTGAPVPMGADGIVRLEDTNCSGTQVMVLAGVSTAKSICRQGAEIAFGEIVLRQGTRLNAGAMGLLAMLGQTKPLVYRRPRVAILATGSEIIDIDQPLAPGKIRNSNSFMLQAQVFAAGGEPVLLGGVVDDTKLICDTLEAAPFCDIYITTGGVSVGDYDLMGQVFDRLAVKAMFNRVVLKPGTPILAGKWRDTLLMGLSGNPAGASVAFELLVRPVIHKLAGHGTRPRSMIRAILTTDLECAASSVTRRFAWGRCREELVSWQVEPLAYQGSGMLKTLTDANALIVIPVGIPHVSKGSEVDVILLN